jgi:predicted small secreted protein
MKKLFLLFAVATMSLSIYSCRETTEEKSEDAMESAGEDIENAAEEAGDEMEEAGNEIEAEAENAEQEMEEEMNEDDNM